MAMRAGRRAQIGMQSHDFCLATIPRGFGEKLEPDLVSGREALRPLNEDISGIRIGFRAIQHGCWQRQFSLGLAPVWVGFS